MYSQYAYSEAAYSEIVSDVSTTELAGAAEAVAGASGALDTEILMEGDAGGQASASGLLGSVEELAGAAAGVADAQGELVTISYIRYNAVWSMRSVTPRRQLVSYSSSMPRRVIH